MEIIPLISFLTGVASILSPCILPVIPIFLAFSLKTKSKTEISAFTLGFISIFVLVIFLTGFFTSLIYRYLFYVRILSAILLFAVGIALWREYSFNLAIKMPEKTEGIAGSFALGFVTSVSWAPCYSAYLISLIGLLVSTANGFYAALNIILYCIGFGLTIFAVSFIISKISFDKLAEKTRYLPKVFAVLIIIGAVYLLWESLKVLI